MSPCPSFPHFSSALRTEYDSSYAEVSGLLTMCKAVSDVIRHWGLPSHIYIWWFCLTWELPPLPSFRFGWYGPRFPDSELLETFHKQTQLAETSIRHAVAVGHDMGQHRQTPSCSQSSVTVSKSTISSWGWLETWGLSPSPSQDRCLETSGSFWSVSAGTELMCEQLCSSSRWSILQ